MKIIADFVILWLIVGTVLHVSFYWTIDDYRNTFYERPSDDMNHKAVRIVSHLGCCILTPFLLIGVLVKWLRKAMS